MSEGQICLIGGTGRSGTTILRTIFNQHPKVAVVQEFRYTIDPDGLVDFYNSFSDGWSPYTFDVKLQRLECLLRDAGSGSLGDALYRKVPGVRFLEKLLRLKLRPRYNGVEMVAECPLYNEFVDELIADLVQFKYACSWAGTPVGRRYDMSFSSHMDKSEIAKVLGSFIEKIMVSVLAEQGAEYFVENNTWNILWFDKLLDLMPQCRIVHVYRDPRDVVASFMNQAWMPSDPVQAAQVYAALISRWWQVRESVPDSAYLEISLESLVAEPEIITRKVCDFWDMEWVPALTNIDLSHSNSGRWRRDIPRDAMPKVEAILSDSMEKLN